MSDIKKFPIPAAQAENDTVSHTTYPEGTLGSVLNPQGDQYTSGSASEIASTENPVDRALPPAGASSTEQEQSLGMTTQAAGEASTEPSILPPPEFGAPQPPSPEEARHEVEEALALSRPPEQQ